MEENNLTNFNMEDIADELKQLIVEAEFNSRWMLIEAYHAAGKIIEEAYDSLDGRMNKEDLVQELAGRIGKSERTLWYANRFYNMFNELNALPEGKNIGWTKVVNKYLTSPAEDPCVHPNKKEVRYLICADCGKNLGVPE